MYRCLLVTRDGGAVMRSVSRQPWPVLGDGEVLIRAEYSSLNYKDALAATGHPGVVKRFPHVPGIDVAGAIVESRSGTFSAGQKVLVTGYDLGAGVWGGWSEVVRVPGDWVVRLPDGLTTREAMLVGTAGFTAALSIEAFLRHGIGPERGEVVVTGASGGVGSLAVALLAKLGYRIAAVTGKPAAEPLLRKLGASSILSRADVDDSSDKPLLPARWAAAVDTVGGNTLATLVRSVGHAGVVAACGLVGGTEMKLTVYPLLLRGVVVAGIESAWQPMATRRELWGKLAGAWKLDNVELLASEVDFDGINEKIAQILVGAVVGRTLVTA
jgi:acrylyl-CoA reductase (NADPH)